MCDRSDATLRDRVKTCHREKERTKKKIELGERGIWGEIYKERKGERMSTQISDILFRTVALMH